MFTLRETQMHIFGCFFCVFHTSSVLLILVLLQRSGEGNQYIQYRANLSGNGTATPTLDSVTANYTQYPLSGDLTSSKYDTGSASSTIGAVSWSASGTDASNIVRFQVRSAATAGGLDTATWCGPDNCTGSYFTTSGQSISNTALTDGVNDQWLQYRAFLTSDGSGNPILISATVAFTVPSSTYTIGGTISGLSGTVVLQNNAGDNLSVLSNNPFTFPTAINDAASYAVTVSAQPSGQTCSVSSGSGTVSGANVSSVAVSCVGNPAPASPAPTPVVSGGGIAGLITGNPLPSSSNTYANTAVFDKVSTPVTSTTTVITQLSATTSTISNPEPVKTLPTVIVRNLRIADGNKTFITEGKVIDTESVIFEAFVFATDDSLVRLEVEVQKNDEPFTGIPLLVSDFLPSGSTVMLKMGGFTNGQYKIKARAKRQRTPEDLNSVIMSSDWLYFGDKAVVDFTVIRAETPAVAIAPFIPQKESVAVPVKEPITAIRGTLLDYISASVDAATVTASTVKLKMIKGAAQAEKIILQIKQETKEKLETPLGKTAVKTVMTTGVAVGGAASFFPLLFTQMFSLKDILFLPAQLWGLLLFALGIKRRHRPWGVVYDSVTKQPLDPAFVRLQTLDGKEVATAFTDLDGRYGFFAPPGDYRIVVDKTNYH